MTERQFYLIITRDAKEVTHVFEGIGTRDSYEARLSEAKSNGCDIVLDRYGFTRTQSRVAGQITSVIDGMPFDKISSEIRVLEDILGETK